MSINRNNYEEYFLLYADNELSEQEKNVVEAFVKQNPDLEEELLIIKLSVSKPEDDCVLEDKSFLFKETNKFIGDSNYQEIFVLYNDDELTSYERKETEAFLIKNPALKHEFELLQKTKLEADNTIVFPDKKLLYRTGSNGKVVHFKWWKAVAAAILLGTGIWFGVLYMQKNNDNLPATVKNDTIKKSNQIYQAPIVIDSTEPVNVVAESKQSKTRKQKMIVKRSISKPYVKETGLPNDLRVVKIQPRSNNLPDRDITTNNIGKEQTKVQDPIDISLLKKTIDTDSSSIKTSNEDDVAIVNEGAKQGAVTTSFAFDENENNNNYAFYNIPQEKFNKSKFGGFLRKVKRIIERKISPFNNTKDKAEIAIN